MASRGEGKFQPITSHVLTPTGWEKIGNIQPGDLVIAGDGTPTEVIGVYHRVTQPIWRLTFSDGATTLAGDEHLWCVETSWDRKGNERKGKTGAARGPKVVTTREIRAHLDRGAWTRGGRWSIPLVDPVQFPSRDVPIDPYLLGLLLGDGSLSAVGRVGFTNADPEIIEAIRAALPTGCELRRSGKKSRYDYRISGSGLSQLLLGLGLMGTRSFTKFIPSVYLWNAPGARLAVLQGLLDTDGTASGHSNSVSYCTTSPQLVEDVAFLVRSLGGLARVRTRTTRYSYKGESREGRLSYHLSVRLPNGTAPFRLQRKLARVTPKGQRNRARRHIISCASAGEERVACLEVASLTDLYVTDDFIVTHNTTAAIYALYLLAQRLETEGLSRRLPLRVAVVRDTWKNLARALSVESPVLTPTGWVKAGDVSVGDMLITQDGSPTHVEGVYPQGVRALWRVLFSDGVEAHVTGDHLWTVQGRWDREQAGARNRRCRRSGWLPARESLRIATTDQLRERLAQSRPRHTWSVPLVSPVQFPTRAVPLDPYVLGVLLGDGGFSSTSVRLSTNDSAIVQRVAERLPAGHTVRKVSGATYDYTLRGTGRGTPNAVRAALIHLGLWGRKSPDKFIPEGYLWNDVETRVAVLQGLMDADGYASLDRHVAFTSTSERLIEGVEFLVRSLGGLATRKRLAPDPGHVLRGHWVQRRQAAWTLAISPPPGLSPFWLPRKAERLQGRSQCHRRWIVAVEPAEPGAAVCFKVDHPSELYVMNDFIVTHNTTIASLKKQAAKGLPIVFMDGEEQALVGNFLHLYFFGMDTRADVDKLQGFECAALWLEEVAPGAELDVGIPAETFGIGATSVRQEGVPKRIIITMNPPDSEHWSLNVDKELAQKGLTNFEFERFFIPSGEKSSHFMKMADQAQKMGRPAEARQWRLDAEEFDQYRALNEAFLESIGRHDLADRLARGKVGGVQIGEAVVSSYESDLHLTKPGERLIAMPGAQIIRAHDAGGTPSTVWIQRTGAGNLDILGSRLSVNLAMAQHILNEVVPFQTKYKLFPKGAQDGFARGQRIGWDFRDVGDPSLFQKDTINNAEISAGSTLEAMLNTTFEPGPVEWAWRRDSTNLAFARPAIGRVAIIVNGQREARPRLIRIDRTENETSLLIKGLAGRAAYPVDYATGRIVMDVKAAKRKSGLYLQALDALMYYLAMDYPAHEWLQKQRQQRPASPEPRDWLGA